MELLLIIAVVIAIIVFKKKKATKAQEVLEQLIYQVDKTGSSELRQKLLDEQKRHGYSDEQMHQIQMNLYRRKAESGDVYAQYTLGRFAMVQKNPGEALRWLTKAAQAGYPDALYQLGNGYSDTYNNGVLAGGGFGYDPAKSFQYYLKAAGAGHVDAICDLARCYDSGEGVAADADKAVSWLKNGVGLKSWRCANHLAVFYYSSPIHPQYYNLDNALALHRQSISYARDLEDFSATLQSMGMIYGSCYVYGGDETPLSDRKKATYCFIMADLADSDRNNMDIVQKIGYSYCDQELTMLQNDVRNMRISF